ncbi:TetR/AcrR family transcriptional regulator [Kibdelosporangium persicum]|uniref:HTH-type transcriptional regulator EthR n=1 Tax=Kibdelosporangium persicum TaxID=2698649 RepID=A0ABX2FCR4_9PSEU|nr:HTH-type transcriptional regulator EthR [Kibdelosporangium persicum]
MPVSATDTRRGAGEPRRRADAERNIAAIIDAATTCFIERPQVSMADVAKAAGVGRVTLYAHFSSREALLEAVLEHVIVHSAGIIEAEAPDQGAADEALRRLVKSSWRELDRHRRLFELAQRELGPQRLRAYHDKALAHVERLIGRGRKEGAFRTDLPLHWLVTTFYSLLHSAGEEVNARRLRKSDVAEVLTATLLPALSPP